MEQQYGCEKQKLEKERFKCQSSCAYKMEDGYCGKLTTIKEIKNEK